MPWLTFDLEPEVQVGAAQAHQAPRLHGSAQQHLLLGSQGISLGSRIYTRPLTNTAEVSKPVDDLTAYDASVVV